MTRSRSRVLATASCSFLFCFNLWCPSALSAATQAKRYTDIKQVDFQNFTYQVGFGDEPMTISTRDGVFDVTEPEEEKVYFKVLRVVFGDLSGDGVDEAVVTTLLNTGGTGQFTDGLIFMLKDGKVEEIASLGIGDRADGGIHDVKISGGKLYVDRYGQENSGACCPEYIETAVLRMTGTKFVEAMRPRKKGYARYEGEPGGPAQAIRFPRGTSGVVLSGITKGKERFSLGARAGQQIILRFTTADKTSTVKLVSPAGKLVATMTPGQEWTGKLPANGEYVISVEAAETKEDVYEDYLLEIGIT